MLRKIGIFNAFSFFFWSSTPFLVAFATFSTFALTSKTPLTAEKIFPAISLFQLLSFPLTVFSNIVSSIIEVSWTSLISHPPLLIGMLHRQLCLYSGWRTF